ncbi:YjgN family protein [Pseudomonas sp. EpS/L25]|uniref:YjgN family protein n=1 Tax=Pseudomonas sp. EpS/L25 TaxID=1749078 RepID=UPI0007435EF1|nr:YjgN family protein [Pseudomonas sp. EpS/L25]KUM43587.1 hypothetical protein AR540_17505 [Pseudomonas sp. EpS/L25]
MPSPTYSVVFSGQIADGFDLEQVKRRFADVYGLSAERLEQLFSAKPVVIKRDIGRREAEGYLQRLNQIGALARLESSTGEPVKSPASAQSVAAPAASLTLVPQQPPATPIQACRQVQDDEPRRLPLEFHGQGGEFFRIWIVNLVLSVLTLGIYSAWAKVRTLRYFYGNTRLDGNAFEYLADPRAILKGRLLMVALLAGYYVLSLYVPLVKPFAGLALLIATPWIVVRALSFHHHHSAWRGVRFGFEARLGEAIKVFIGWPLLGVVTLGILYPVAVQRQQAFIASHSRFGTQGFSFQAGVGPYYRMVLGIIGLVVLGMIANVALSLTGSPSASIIVLLLTYQLIFVYVKVTLTNLYYRSTRAGVVRLGAHYGLASYSLLVLTNLVGMLLTLGLFYPWARVRTARYAAEHITLEAEGDVEAFIADQRSGASATGGEAAELFGVDLGL